MDAKVKLENMSKIEGQHDIPSIRYYVESDEKVHA